MIRVSVMYPNGANATFDVDYYCQRHMALVQELLAPSLKGLGVDWAVENAEAPAPYIAVGYLIFDTVADFQAALATHGPELLADIPNYTNTRPVFQISEIRM
ncbi:MAG TPA: EthD family reductase [Bryobacteraceae bacterium]|nr:EthD family reductase [Bryobacteraceae bacterium]